MTILIDGDSIAYMAGIAETEKDCYTIVDEYMNKILNNEWEEEYELYVETPKEGKVNFRNQVAITRPYKGNRKGKSKPAFLYEAKWYMHEKYGATLVNIYESEDMVAIRQNELGQDNCTIAYLDKDLLQIPGKFFNYRTGETLYVTEEQANKNLYYQILTGDHVDNIPGLEGVGKALAHRMVGSLSTVDELSKQVALAYIKRGKSYSYLIEQARLVYLLRSADDVFNFPISREDYEQWATNLREGNIFF